MSSLTEYRDAVIRVGEIVQRYMEAFMARGDGRNQKSRNQFCVTHEWAMARAARKLGVTKERLGIMLGVAAVVRLLSDGGDVGGMRLTSLRLWTKVVCRIPGDVMKTPGDGLVLPSEKEKWQVRDDIPDAAGVFRKAVREGWDYGTTRRYVTPLASKYKGRKAKTSATSPDGISVFVPPSKDDVATRLKATAALCCPRDLAELIADLIGCSTDPPMVASILESSLGQFKQFRRNTFGD